MRTIDPARQLAKRQHILEAAVTCFAKRGFHATSTSQICKQADMSPGNLFHYFPTKDAIIQAIAEEDRRETAAALAAIAEAPNVVSAILALAQQELRAATDPVYRAISIEVAAEATRNPAVAAMFAINDKSARAALVALLQRGVALGQIEPDLELDHAASWLIALMEGAVGRAALDQGFDDTTQFATLSRLITRFLTP
jgi:TetR/AcrR family transcriptional regulator, repressor for uid operon